MNRQCPSCGGFCKKSGCERENVKPEPEPVAWWHDRGDIVDLNVSGHGTPLYFAPPQREWVGLTDDEIEDCLEMSIQGTCRAIEAKLKEKNGVGF